MDVAAVVVALVVTSVSVGMSGFVFMVTFDFWSDKCPHGIHTPLEGPLYLYLFLVQHLWVGTNSAGPVCKGVEYTVLGR